MAKLKDTVTKETAEIVAETLQDPQAEIVEKITSRINQYNGYIGSKKESMKKWWRLYRAQLDEPDYDYLTNRAVPYTTAAIETIVPRLVETDTGFVFEGETEEDDINSKYVTELVNDQMRKDKLELTKIDLYKEAMVLGTAFGKVTWKTRKRTVKRRKPIIKIGGIKIGEIEKTVEKLDIDRASIEHIPFDKIAFDPYGIDINGENGCDWIAHIKFVSKDKLRLNPNYDQAKVAQVGTNATGDSTLDPVTEMTKPADETRELVEIIEYWEDDRVVVVANRETVLRDEPNPYDDKKKPFVRFVDRPIPGQLLGMGEVEFLYGMQTLLNELVNQAFAVQKVALNKLIFLEKGSGVDKDRLVSQPFGVHTIDDLTKLKVVDIPGVDPMTVELIMMLKTFMEHVSGISDYSKGTGSADLNDTATGIKLIQEAANYVFRVKIKLAAKMFLTELGDMLVSRNQQFLNRTYTVKIKAADGSEKWEEITNENIQGNFETKVNEKPPASETTKRQEALMLRREFLDDPDVDQIELKKNVFEAFDKDTSKMLRLPTAVDLETEAEMTEAEQSAEAEDQIMFEGKHVTVSEQDDHEIHIIVHEQALSQADDEIHPMMYDHIEEHKAFMSPRIREIMLNQKMGGMDEEAENGIPEGLRASLGEASEVPIEDVKAGSQGGFEGESL